MRQIDGLRGSPRFDAALARAADRAKALLAPQTAAAAPPPAGGMEGLAPPPRAGGLEPLAPGFAEAPAARLAADPDPARIDRAAERLAEGRPPEGPWDRAVEAIVLDEMRPPWLIVEDRIVVDRDFDRPDLVTGQADLFNDRARPVGRVDLIHHLTHDFVGTGWPIAPGIVVTNRHVAQEFTTTDAFGTLAFRRGRNEQRIEAILNGAAQHATTNVQRRAFVDGVLYVAGPGEPDFAFLRLSAAPGFDPLPLAAAPAKVGDPVAAIGYPAEDSRNDSGVMARVFGSIYNVKRFSPGYVMGLAPDEGAFTTDYSTLGGNSGSAVVSLLTGEVVGLHFAGLFHEANWAVPIDLVAAALRRVLPPVVPGAALPDPAAPAAPALATEAAGDPVTDPADLADREGYDAAFLGADHPVPLPDPGDWADDLAPVAGAEDRILRYRHFSVLQSASRRLPLLTAVNIDGARARRLKRAGRWRLDGRLDPAHQVGDALYAGNPLDKGHLVRRRDPGWGTEAAARQAESDSFHYTNAAPQHARMNQRSWVGLEDHLLDAAQMHGFLLSVFTGPVLRDGDRRLKAAEADAAEVAIPEEYWKVAAMIDAETGDLHATGYVLSQGRLIRPLTEAAFVFGAYETYQVPIALIAAATGLDFGVLAASDPLMADTDEGPAIRRAVLIRGADDLVL